MGKSYEYFLHEETEGSKKEIDAVQLENDLQQAFIDGYLEALRCHHIFDSALYFTGQELEDHILGNMIAQDQREENARRSVKRIAENFIKNLQEESTLSTRFDTAKKWQVKSAPSTQFDTMSENELRQRFEAIKADAEAGVQRCRAKRAEVEKGLQNFRAQYITDDGEAIEPISQDFRAQRVTDDGELVDEKVEPFQDFHAQRVTDDGELVDENS